MDIYRQDITLEDAHVKLVPASIQQAEDLAANMQHSIWKNMDLDILDTESMKSYLSEGMWDRYAQKRYMFTIIDKSTLKPVGCTSLAHLSTEDKRVEIQNTWILKDHQGTGIYQSVQYLLLGLCFEKMKLDRVEYKVRGNNLPARKALIKCGAREEGRLRNYQKTKTGLKADIILFSILKDEWKALKQTIFADYEKEALCA